MAGPNIDTTPLTRLELYFSIRQFTRTTRRFAQVFNRDYEMVMIFFVVVEACFQAILNLGGAPATREAIEAIYLDATSIGVSIFGIADASGIPRETVRRKVKTLTDRGFLATDDKTKNVYVPVSALFDMEILEAFRLYGADLDQLVRNIHHYGKPGP